MTFGAVSPLRAALGVPSTKVPISVTTFVSHVVPPVICYVALAVLAVTPRTRTVRVALWPVMALLGFRAAASVDMSLGNPKRILLNVSFARTILYMVVQALFWSLTRKPLVRRSRPANTPPSTIMDAFDLISNLRGHGWDWSRGLHVPRHTRPKARTTFIFCTLLSGIINAFICGSLYRAINTLTARTASSSKVYTIFDDSLPFFVSYARACIISTLAAIAIHSVVQTSYDELTLLGVLVFGQDPAQWPPAFDKPWRATSLSNLWGCRWHQFWRHTFVTGAYPFSVVLGRRGMIIGAFVSSALFHHLSMIAFDSQSESWRMFVGFGMMAVGVLAERGFYKLTGRRVGGAVGGIWVVVWLLLWGNFIVDGFARAGAFLSSSPIDSLLPTGKLVERLVIDFDAWLHTI